MHENRSYCYYSSCIFNSLLGLLLASRLVARSSIVREWVSEWVRGLPKVYNFIIIYNIYIYIYILEVLVPLCGKEQHIHAVQLNLWLARRTSTHCGFVSWMNESSCPCAAERLRDWFFIDPAFSFINTVENNKEITCRSELLGLLSTYHHTTVIIDMTVEKGSEV